MELISHNGNIFAFILVITTRRRENRRLAQAKVCVLPMMVLSNCASPQRG